MGKIDFIILGGLISWTVNVGIGIAIFVNNSHNRINRNFSFFNICIGFWSLGSFFINITSNNAISIWFLRASYIFAILLISAFIYFLFAIIDQKPSKRLKQILLIYSIFLLLFLPSRFFIKDIAIIPSTNLYISDPGIIYYIFAAGFTIAGIYGIKKLLKEESKLTGIRKNQIKYLIISTTVAFLAGGDYFLSVFKVINQFPADDYILVVSFLITAYAILKYHLLDINIAITRVTLLLLVYASIFCITFYVGYATNSWLPTAISGIILSAPSPIIYNYLRRRAEDIILREQRRYQEALTDLSRNLIRIKELDELSDAITSTIVSLMKIEFTALYIKDDSAEFRLKSYKPDIIKDKVAEKIPYGSRIIIMLNDLRRPLISEEIGAVAQIQTNIGLIVPCFSRQGLLGFIALGPKPSNQIFTHDDITVIEAFAYSSSFAIENCLFWKEIEDRQRKARLQEMDTYSYSLAHEIDNPVQVIIGQTTVLKQDVISDLPQAKQKEVSDSFDFIMEAARRVSGMVKAIRDFGQPIGEAVPVKMDEVIDSFYKLYFPQFKAKSVTCVINGEKDLGYVQGHKPELMQILIILANNSMHAMKFAETKAITIKAAKTAENKIRITFSDSGYGIKKELLPIIFAPFTTTKASSEGTGMGLYNAKKIVERHGGTIWAESQGQGKGATFVIEFPAVLEVNEAEAIKASGNSKKIF